MESENEILFSKLHPDSTFQDFGDIGALYGYGVISKEELQRKTEYIPFSSQNKHFNANISQNLNKQVSLDEIENPETFEKLKKKLESAQISFKHTTHEPVLTSQQAADVRGTKLESGAKAILIRFKNKKNVDEFSLVVMSAVRKLDSKKIKKQINSKSISFADNKEVKEITKCLPGAVPPFGSLWNIQTFMDQSLRNCERIDFNAGLRTNSFEMNQIDYERIERPIVGDFTSD